MPSAIFLLMIDAQMSGMLSTVPVTSLSAYSFRSAGAISDVWPMSAHPIVDTAVFNSSRESRSRNPGIDFELVERAARMAQTAARHHRHERAARGSERGEDERRLVADAAGAVLVDRDAAADSGSSTRTPDRTIASVSAAVSSAVMPRRRIAISSADAW